MVTLDYIIDIDMAKKEIDKETVDHSGLHAGKKPKLDDPAGLCK